MFEEYNPADDDEMIVTEEGGDDDEFSEEEFEQEEQEGDDSIGEEESNEEEGESEEEEDLIDTWAKQRDNYQQTAADQTANRVMESVSTSPLIQEIIKYRNMGYTDDQIALGIAKLHAQQLQQGQPQQQYESQEQEGEQQPDIRMLIQQEIQRALSPVQSQIQQQQSQQKLAENVNHNKSMFESAFKKFGITDINNENTIKAIGTAVNALYPGISLKEHSLTKEQAEAIIALSMKKIGTKKKISGSKSASAPNILGGQTSNGKVPTVQSKGKIDGTSKQERKQNINKLFL